MQNYLPLIAVLLVAYVVASRLALRFLSGFRRELALVFLNLPAVFALLLYRHNSDNLSKVILYSFIAVSQYVVFRLFCEAPGRLYWVAFATPLFFLAIIRYTPSDFYRWLGGHLGRTWTGLPVVLGISYLTFRCSRLVLEVRNGSVKKPGFLEYLNFAFFLPTMVVGPINSYSNFRRGFEAQPYETPAGRALLRIVVGFIKFQFLAGVIGKLAYDDFLRNGHPHHWPDLVVAMVAYYLFLYWNFSGFCDMAIGGAALIGIPVLENFENPLAARNVKEFWNRWHITLSVWMRDIVFSPLSKFLVGKFGARYANAAIAISITVVFLLIGIWHGVGWNYAAFGLAHSVALVANFYYTIFLKKRLGREGFKRYTENRWIQAASVTLTFCYCGAALMLFANTFAQLKEIFSVLR